MMTRQITSQVYDANVLYEGIQHQIDQYYEPKDPVMQRRIDIVLAALKPQSSETILDIGCGVGTFAFHIAKTAQATTIGIDYSKESINIGRELAVRYGLGEKISYTVGNALALPFKDNTFDRIVSADFIEHITHDEKKVLLKEMMRVLKPGGTIVIFTPNAIREAIGAFYWKVRHLILGDRIPFTDLHYGLIDKFTFERILKNVSVSFSLSYSDIHRPYLASLPLIRTFLALNLLWTIVKHPKIS